MYASPSNLSAEARRDIAAVLNARLADGLGDGDTVDLLTQIVAEVEKNAWFLRATAEAD